MIIPSSFIFLLIVLLFIILGLWRATKHGRFRRSGSEQLETDLRLTYKRFKELYPHSDIAYQEYKRLQAQKAYKRAVSSEKIKRMVR